MLVTRKPCLVYRNRLHSIVNKHIITVRRQYPLRSKRKKIASIRCHKVCPLNFFSLFIQVDYSSWFAVIWTSPSSFAKGPQHKQNHHENKTHKNHRHLRRMHKTQPRLNSPSVRARACARHFEYEYAPRPQNEKQTIHNFSFSLAMVW